MRPLTEMTAAEIEAELADTGVEVSPLVDQGDGHLIGTAYRWPALNFGCSSRHDVAPDDACRFALWVYREKRERAANGSG